MNTNVIERLTGHRGIEAVLFGGAYQGRESVNGHTVDISAPVLERAHAIAQLVQHDVRITVGVHTILAQYEEDSTIVVAIPTGHPVAKSLRRMIKRAKHSTRSR